MSNSMEHTTSSDNLELNIEELPNIITGVDAHEEASQIASAAAESKLEQQKDSEEEDDEINLLKRPNNLPCKGFHKEIIKKKGHANRIHIYIYPPAAHADIVKKVLNDDKIKNKRGLGLYLAELKKQGMEAPPGCSKDSFGTFYTKATSLSGIDRELFEAFNEAEEDDKSIDTDEDSDDTEDDEEDSMLGAGL